MVNTTVDVFVSEELQDDDALLTLRGVDLSGVMRTIPLRDLWTLRGAKTKHLVALTVEQDVEDFYHPSIGLSVELAKKLKLRTGHRYALTIDEAKRLIVLKKYPVSLGVFPIVIQNGARKSNLLAGFRAHSALGLPLAHVPVICSNHAAQEKLRVKVSTNLNDGDALIVHEEKAKRLGLKSGQLYGIAYNQSTKMLTIGSNKTI
jgi:hypothetical protein